MRYTGNAERHPLEVDEGLLAAAGGPGARQVQVERQQHGVHGQVGQHVGAPRLQREAPRRRVPA